MSQKFPDRRDRLFGRAKDVRRLLDRANQPGLTAVVARPRMGKTWLLTEVARQLAGQGDHIVGYHEFKGSETSHLLHAVSDLYARWLCDSTLRQQASMSWRQQARNMTPRVGKMVGSLFASFSGSLLPEAIGKLVRSAFDGLAEKQQSLKNAGIQLAPLPYEQAESLVKLVALTSNRKPVLVLDAWEKSLSLSRSELTLLQAFLQHEDSWSGTHIFLGIRSPEVDSTRLDVEAHQRARDLCRLFPRARQYDLQTMDEAEGQARIVSFVKARVHAARGVEDSDILELLAGYPGVLDHWTTGENVTEMHRYEDLRRIAADAQANRYPELEHLLNNLQDNERLFAARVAFLAGLDAVKWPHFKDLLLEGLPAGVINSLHDKNVLVDEPFPSYGHDTRHAVALSWLVCHARPLMRRVSHFMIESLAARVTGPNRESVPYVEALVASIRTSETLDVDATCTCLLDAAQSAFNQNEAIMREYFHGACATAVGRNGRVAPLIAMALLNRGYANSLQGENAAAKADYDLLVSFPSMPAEYVAQGLCNRGILKGQLGDVDGELEDYARLIDLPGAPINDVGHALYNRGIARAERQDLDGAIADYTAVIDLPGAPPDHVAHALNSRGFLKGELGDVAGELADLYAVIELSGAPPARVIEALCSRAVRRNELGEIESALEDYGAAIALTDTPAKQRARARYNRGIILAARGETDKAIADFSEVIALAGAPIEAVAHALLGRGVSQTRRGNYDDAIVDYRTIIALPGAPPESVAQALHNRAVIRSELGDFKKSIEDYDTLISLPGAATDQVITALNNRGIAKGSQGDFAGEIADLDVVIAHSGASAERVAQALYNRALSKKRNGNAQGEDEDYEAAITLRNAPPDVVALTLYTRAIRKSERGDVDGEIADYRALMELSGAPGELVALATDATRLYHAKGVPTP